MILAPTDAVDVQRELAAMRAEVAAIRTRMQDGWLDELPAMHMHFAKFGHKLPEGLRNEIVGLEKRLQAAKLSGARL